MAELMNTIVLVTGGSGGLGRVLAQAFARQGSRVVITARSEARLTAAAEEIGRAGGQVLALPCDWVSDKGKGRIFLGGRRSCAR